MKISTRFIDDKGFIHFWTGRNKLLVLKYIKMLANGTEIKWISKSSVFISQQYIEKSKQQLI